MNNKTISEGSTQILNNIKNGVYRNSYLVYNRKSTDEPNNQKNSIKYQKSENLRFAMRERLPIASVSLDGLCLDGIISEKHSGFKEDIELTFGKDGTVQYKIDRPKFYRLVEYLSKGYFKGVVFLCWDRASRNKGDNNIIEKLIRQGIDLRFTLATYDKTSSGALHMDIDGMFAQHHSRVTSEKVSLSIRNQRSKGICTYKAPVGYLNSGSMEHKPFDSIRAPIVKQLFEKYAEGNWSLADLARWANAQGLTMPPVRKRRTKEDMLSEEVEDNMTVLEPVSRPIRANNVHKILTSPFYTGKIFGNDGQLIASNSHSALISDALFSVVQSLMRKKNVSVHYTQKLVSPYRGMVRCAECKRVYTPYTQKGIMYYGCRCNTACGNSRKNFNISFLEQEIGDRLRTISFTEAELDELNARTQTDIALLEKKRNTEIDQIERKKRKVREDLNYLRSNKLALLRTGVYTVETYMEEEFSLDKELSVLQTHEQASDASMHEVIQDVTELSELLKDLYLTYKKGNSNEKEEILRKLFSELYFSENTFTCKWKNGLQLLENRFNLICAQTTWISELVNNHKFVQESIEDIKAVLQSVSIPP